MLKISVIIPVFNDFDNLKLALKSIYNQSIVNKGIVEFDIIIIDDASDEEEYTLFFDENKNETGIIIYRNEFNQGPAAARNKGLAMADGDYITFLDSDDQWTVNRTSYFLDYFTVNTDVDVIFCHTQMFVQKGINHKYKNYEIVKEILMGSMIYKNNRVTSLLRFNESLRYGEDLDFWMQLKDLKAVIHHVPEVGLKRYIHGKNMTLDKIFEPKKVLFNIIKERLKKNE